MFSSLNKAMKALLYKSKFNFLLDVRIVVVLKRRKNLRMVYVVKYVKSGVRIRDVNNLSYGFILTVLVLAYVFYKQMLLHLYVFVKFTINIVLFLLLSGKMKVSPANFDSSCSEYYIYTLVLIENKITKGSRTIFLNFKFEIR